MRQFKSHLNFKLFQHLWTPLPSYNLAMVAPDSGTVGRIRVTRVVAKSKAKLVTGGKFQLLFLVLSGFGNLLTYTFGKFI